MSQPGEAKELVGLAASTRHSIAVAVALAPCCCCCRLCVASCSSNTISNSSHLTFGACQYIRWNAQSAIRIQLRAEKMIAIFRECHSWRQGVSRCLSPFRISGAVPSHICPHDKFRQFMAGHIGRYIRARAARANHRNWPTAYL